MKKRLNWMMLAVLCAGSAAFADMYATLTAGGRVWTFDSDDFSGTTNELAILPAGAAYLDVTFGDGLIYGLRSDGKVFSCDLSGTTNEVALTGWANSFYKIDYAGGTLYGLRTLSGGAHYAVYDAAGNTALTIYNRTAADFAVRSSGYISVLQGTNYNQMLTFTNGHVGADSGQINATFFSSDPTDAPIALDINGNLASVLTRKSTGAEEWKYQDGLGGTVVFGKGNIFDAGYLAISADASQTLFVNPGYGANMRVLDETSTQVGLIPRFGTLGVGIAAIDAGSPASGYDVWAALYSLTNGASGDDDGDGVANLSEYALDGNPTNSADRGTMPELVYGAGDVVSYSHIALTNENRGIEYLVEWNDNLVTGSWSNAGWSLITTNTSANPDFEEVEYQISGAAENQLFFRLNIGEL